MYPGTHAREDPDRLAVVSASTGEQLTYGQLDDESVRIAQVFRALGLAIDDVVAILMGNDVHYLSACWAAQRSGLRFVPINWHLTPAEARYVVEDSGARALVVGRGCDPTVAAEVARAPGLRACLHLGFPDSGLESLADAMAVQDGGELDNEWEGSDMIYSSGTTGLPKGGRRALAGRHPADFPAAALAFYDLFGLSRDSIYLTPGAPLYHAAPLRFSMMVHRYGGANVLLDRFDPVEALAAIDRYRVSHSQWVPTMFVRLLRVPLEERARWDLTSHQVAVHSAAPCPLHVKRQMIDWWGPILHEYYGASEGGLLTHLTSTEWLERQGSVGRAVLGTVHVLDDDGLEVATGESGTIYAEAGRPVDYLNDPAKTRAAHSAQGWATVGDVGFVDADGYVYLTDRRDHMIISGGVNIYPQEVENVLLTNRHVADVAVIGVPDPDLGEQVKAVVELVDPSSASDDLAAELVDLCKSELARFKVPRSLEFVAALPRSPSGKLYKRRLRDLYAAGTPGASS